MSHINEISEEEEEEEEYDEEESENEEESEEEEEDTINPTLNEVVLGEECRNAGINLDYLLNPEGINAEKRNDRCYFWLTVLQFKIPDYIERKINESKEVKIKKENIEPMETAFY